ncbi:MAG TPA: hypothetical protein VK166_08030 [Chitinophagaceae bacterium]|nr:hypothetical protein [Chitinophagaceae bacterium]
MKRSAMALMLLLIFAFQTEAQKQTKQYLGKVKYEKTEQEATIFEVPYPAGQVEEGLKGLAEKQGVKVREKNGFYEARGLVLQKIGSNKHDVYYKVEKDGKNESKVYMILAEPGEDLTNRTSSHAELAGSAAGGAVILASIAPHLDEHDFNMVKMDQEAEIKKAERKLADLQDEQTKLQKRLADINKELDKNAQDQQKLTADLETKKSGLEELLNKRGNGKTGKKD